MSNKNKNTYEEELRIAENNLIKEELLEKPLGRKNRMRMIVYLVIIAAAAVSFFAVVLALFFKINTITIKGTGRYSSDEILEAISTIMETNRYNLRNMFIFIYLFNNIYHLFI